MTKICLINGHPDPSPERFCAALAAAYAQAASDAGHEVHRIAVGRVPLDFLHGEAEFDSPPPEPIAQAQESVRAAEHVVLVYPLWLGTMPARLKAFLEQLGRDHFFIGPTDGPGWPAKNLRGRSARVIVTMGMPGIAYRTYFGAHSLRALESGILGLAGFKPVRDTIFGMVASPNRRERMLAKTRLLGERAA